MTNHTPTPRSNNPEDVQKRNFIVGLTTAILGFLTLALTGPLVSYLMPATSGGSDKKFIKVPNFSKLAVGQPTKLTTVNDTDVQAFISTTVVYEVWVIKHAADKATVYSPLCPHLNCRYNFDDSKKEFACPCHGSIFNEEGKCTGGPAPRPLDTLPYKIEAGELYIQYELFKAGIPEKIEA